MAAFHARTPEEVVRALATDPERGLSSEEAERRLRRYGKNVLPRREGRSPLAILLGQFASPLVAVLIAAASVSFFLGEVREALAVLAILLLNALLGFSRSTARSARCSRSKGSPCPGYGSFATAASRSSPPPSSCPGT